ncbi:YitT family protein [Microaceticoccus formicicus]|uniref:YitT family protein n=1 Tax=Microaceticoccus formicicus TaxID=3118105 RepID=UPI003CD04D2F|nr:YitT family protein [Peptoniphilaceae bacterium AMB_02]
MEINKNISKLLAVIIGELLCAIAITYFFVPHKLLSGGIGGIAIMIQYLTNYSSGIFIFLFNIPLFILGFKKLTKNFMFYTFISANLLSIYLMVLKAVNFNFQIDDIILSAIFGGVINGIGMGIMFRFGTSQGGLDILAIIARKDWNMNIGSALLGMNLIIVLIASVLFGLTRGLYTIVAMYIGYQVVDKVISGFDVKKQILIVSKHSHEIAQKIMVDPHRGVTYFQAKGAYTGDSKDVIYCVANNRQVVRIKEVVDEIDPRAFMSISPMTEVKGKGFANAEI